MSRAPSPFALANAVTALREAHRRLMTIDASIEQDERLLQDMLESEAEGDPYAIIDRFVKASRQDAMYAKASRKEAQIMAERAKRLEERHEARRNAVMNVLQILGMRRLERPTYTARIDDGKPGVVIIDETKLPDDYTRISREPNKSLIGKALMDGFTVDGAELRNSAPHIVITPGDNLS